MIDKFTKNLQRWEMFIIPSFFLALTLLYLFPLLQGLILLPLDLLISNYAPWNLPNVILLKNPYMQDSIVQLFPWRHLVFQSLTTGVIPLWNPYQMLGMPFMATLKPMVFYPLNIFFIFGEIKAWNLLLFSQIFLSLLFSYILARSFKLSRLVSILVSFAFSLNSYMIGLLEFGSDAHTIIWWPLIFFCAKFYIEKKKPSMLFTLSLALACSIFAGQIQYIGYLACVLGAFIVYYGLQNRARKLTYVSLIISIFLGFGVSAIQLFPAIELFSYSHRGLLTSSQIHEVFSRGLMTPWFALRLLAPDFFGNPVTRDTAIAYIETSGYFGIIPFFFALYAIVFERKTIFVRFFTAVFIISLLLSFNGIGEILYWLRIPILTSGSGERIFLLVLFSGSILSGFGLSSFLQTKDRKRQLLSILGFLCSVILVVGAYVISNRALVLRSSFIHNTTFASGMVVLFLLASLLYIVMIKKKIQPTVQVLFVLVLLALSFIDFFRFGYRFLTFSNKKFLYPNTPVTAYVKKISGSNLGRSFGLTEPEIATYLNVYTVETYNPLYPLRTSTLLQVLQGKTKDALSIDNKYFLTSDSNYLKRTLDFLGVTSIVADKDVNPATQYFHSDTFQSEMQGVYKDDKYAVYNNMGAFPRFGLYYQAKVIADSKKQLELFYNWDTDFRNMLLLEKNLPITLEKGTGSATLLLNNPNTQKFKIDTDKPALFYISDTFFPGWNATINNKKTEIFRADYNFRAVLVPAGTSIVAFSYMPFSFVIGAILSLVSFIGTLMLLFVVKKFQ